MKNNDETTMNAYTYTDELIQTTKKYFPLMSDIEIYKMLMKQILYCIENKIYYSVDNKDLYYEVKPILENRINWENAVEAMDKLIKKYENKV
jgi:hypothetical protein